MLPSLIFHFGPSGTMRYSTLGTVHPRERKRAGNALVRSVVPSYFGHLKTSRGLFPEQLGIEPDKCKAGVAHLQHGERQRCPVAQFGPNASLGLTQDFDGSSEEAEGLRRIVNFHHELSVQESLAIDDQNAFSTLGSHIWTTTSRPSGSCRNASLNKFFRIKLL
jgi:hypothetical protein